MRFVVYEIICCNSLDHFTFWISFLLRLSLSPKFRPRPKITQKVNSFFVWTQRFAERFAETKLRTEQSLNPKHRLILHAQDRLISQKLSFYERKSLHFFVNSKINNEIWRNQRWTADDVSDDALRWLVNLNSGLRPKLSCLVSVFGLSVRLIQKVRWLFVCVRAQISRRRCHRSAWNFAWWYIICVPDLSFPFWGGAPKGFPNPNFRA